MEVHVVGHGRPLAAAEGGELAGLVGLLGRFDGAVPDRLCNLGDAYFGETHVHTSYSVDAWLFGDRMTGPADAYKYFKGEAIKAPLGYDIKITTPLDFAGVTDHSEYVGVIKLANDPSSPISKLPAAQPLILKSNTPEAANEVFLYAINHLMRGAPNKDLDTVAMGSDSSSRTEPSRGVSL